MSNVQKPCKVMCVTLRRHVGVLYTDGARFTHRSVREQRRLGLEIEHFTKKNCFTYYNTDDVFLLKKIDFSNM